MNIKKLLREALMPTHPYEQSTFYFPENMQKLGYKVNGNDTIVDANAKVMLDMAKRIAALEQQVESIAALTHRHAAGGDIDDMQNILWPDPDMDDARSKE